MKTIYVPVFKTAVNYTVSVGRRWTVLEHMLLVELAGQRRSTAELAKLCSLPNRIVVEALIRLLQANWIELRTTSEGVQFTATIAGKKRATEEHLPVQLTRDIRWTSLCFERVTGSWLRSDDVSLVYEKELPEDANRLLPSYVTVNTKDGGLKDLFYVPRDESLEAEEPRFTRPSQPFIRTFVSFDKVNGLPEYAPLRLKQEILEYADTLPEGTGDDGTVNTSDQKIMRDTINEGDVIVGGQEHLDLLRQCLEESATTCIVHSCFVHPKVIEKLLPDFEKAARRKVRIELLWGLRRDPESTDAPPTILESEKVLDRLSPSSRARVKLSSMSSGSHCKIIMYDDAKTKRWNTVVSSCNFLSSWFQAHDISVRLKSPQFAVSVLGWLIMAQQPASGAWPPTARRLDRVWSLARQSASILPEKGEQELTLLVDADHYACVRRARDLSKNDVIMGCDLFGLAAETTSIVPLETTASRGKRVDIYYQRPSRLLVSEGRQPDHAQLLARGINTTQTEALHGKFLLWDNNDIAITSFNWLSTVVDGSRQTGAELGVWISGQRIRKTFEAQVKLVPGLGGLNAVLCK